MELVLPPSVLSTVSRTRILVLEVVDSFRSLTFKHQSSPLTALLGSLAMLGGLELMEAAAGKFAPKSVVSMGSFAALATLLFGAPAAPLGFPWNAFLGHIVSVGVAISYHWMQTLLGVNMLATVVAPSIAIAMMTHLKVTNPPAAAAAFIFLTMPEAQAQPLWGIFFLFVPALFGCVWAFAVQAGLSACLDVIRRQADERLSARTAMAASPTTAAVTPSVAISVTDPYVATCIAQAVEGAAYVDDPLSYIIRTLDHDRARVERKRRVLYMLGAKGIRADGETRDAAATRLQRRFRQMTALRFVQAVRDSAARRHSGATAAGPAAAAAAVAACGHHGDLL